jgi:predicted enzyme related to lactoylglutathione lyase
MVSDFEARGSYVACLYANVADVGEAYSRAVAAGVQAVEEPLDTPGGQW